MVYPKIPLAQSIIEIFVLKGIKNIVISPGSRNAPLTIGFVSNPFFNCYSIADERCAAFFALGIAQQSENPVVVLCTSGSALLNYYPAFAEAFYSQIPLIVLSADRPFDKIDIGDGQTIRQQNVFKNHSVYNANLIANASLQNDMKLNKAIHFAHSKKGPVHINAPFEEPLYETTSELVVDASSTEFKKNRHTISVADLTKYATLWNKSKKKLLLIGQNKPDLLDLPIIEALANDPSVVIMTETTSNLHHNSFLNSIDTIITPFTEHDFKKLQADILITFGGMVVSKKVKSFLRSYTPEHHWHIDTLRAYNTYGCLSKHFKVDPNLFFNKFLTFTRSTNSNYRSYFQGVKATRKLKHQLYLSKIPFSDFKAFDQILSTIPENCMLQVSNSSAIRYMQLFDIKNTVTVYCNRGTSGIDGSTSTAIGAAVASQKQVVLLTGDISFLYDSNALWNQYIPKKFKIILINNGGGGIFRILPGHQDTPVFTTFFETSHSYNAEHLAKMYGFDYWSVSTAASLEENLSLFYAENIRPSILEIFTPTIENDKILVQYFKELV